jgi:hypothetical protein
MTLLAWRLCLRFTSLRDVGGSLGGLGRSATLRLIEGLPNTALRRAGGVCPSGGALACSARLDAAPRFETLFTSLRDVGTCFNASATIVRASAAGVWPGRSPPLWFVASHDTGTFQGAAEERHTSTPKCPAVALDLVGTTPVPVTATMTAPPLRSAALQRVAPAASSSACRAQTATGSAVGPRPSPSCAAARGASAEAALTVPHANANLRHALQARRGYRADALLERAQNREEQKKERSTSVIEAVESRGFEKQGGFRRQVV